MSKPDFSAYSETQLRQVLPRIDPVKYPERVREIEVRLAALLAPSQVVDPATLLTPSQVVEPATLAGRWRRLGAFLIDMLLLATVGLVAGALFHAQFAAMGAWGRAVGFLIALAYFSIMESRAGGGSSVGKRICNLQVVGRSGALLDAPAVGARTVIFCLAYFLNGAHIGGAGNQWMTLCQSVLIFGLIISLFYLLAFNGRTHQSIHDLAVGAFVVRGRSGAFSAPPEPVWRGHLAIVGVALAAVFAGGLFWQNHMPMKALMASYQAIGSLPDIERVSVSDTMYSSGQATQQLTIINGVIDNAQCDQEALAVRMANLALDTDPDLSARQQIVVVLSWGYDIGIASHWNEATFAWSPAQWRAMASKHA